KKVRPSGTPSFLKDVKDILALGLLVHLVVDMGDLPAEAQPLPVLHAHQLLISPVQVISQKSYLLVDAVQGIAFCYSPRSGTSTLNFSPQLGQVTSIFSGSTELIC